MKSLERFTPVDCDEYVKIKLPVIIDVGNAALTLHIIPLKDGYRVTCPEDYFDECNGTQRRYYDIFMKWYKGRDFNVRLDEDDLIYRDYESDYSPLVAVSNMIRFFIRFDDFITYNYVVGRERQFEGDGPISDMFEVDK